MNLDISPSWDNFALFTKEELEAECLIYDDLEKENTASWEDECQKYEKTMSVVIDHKKKRVPRRNYINKEAKLQDETLFPYHASCYSLLDAYECLYDNPKQQPVSKAAVPTSSFPPPPVYNGPARMMPEIQGYLPCSLRSIAGAIFRISQVNGGQNASYFFGYVISCLAREISGCIRDGTERRPFDDMVSRFLAGTWGFVSTPTQCGPVEFPTDNPLASRELLLSLLRHGLSEIQRDHLLAQAAISRLNAEGHLEDVEFFRRFLIVAVSEYIFCDEPCDEPEDHVCDEWTPYHNALGRMLGFHTMLLTKEHGLAIAGFMRRLFLREFGHLKTDATHSETEKMKNELKRTLVMQREDNADDREVEITGSEVPVNFVVEVLSSLLLRACLERGRMESFLAENSDRTSDEKIEKCLQSYRVCVATLVTIAEDALLYLPPVERFCLVGSELVKNLTLCLVGAEFWFLDIEAYIGKERTDLETLSAPFRFSDIIQKAVTLNAQRRFPQQRDNQSAQEVLLNQCRQVLYGRPPDEIRFVVRQLFVSDMVHIQYAWMGYGDFLVWCRYQVNPLDPVLFCHEFNYHIDDSSSSDDDSDDDESEETEWDVDEVCALLLLRLDIVKTRVSLYILADGFYMLLEWQDVVHE